MNDPAREVTHGGLSKLGPPPPVLEITRALEKAGFEAWCVGGAVRDALLGETHLDWDLATDATPDQVRTVFGRKRTIPVGIEYGTVGVLDSDGVLHEVTTFRRDVRTDGRHAEVEFGASLDEDLARRDFTINAIAYSPTSSELRDPFGGQRDLKNRVVRAVGAAAERMREDRLRALRAIRFAARFAFEIDEETWDAVRESSRHLTNLSAERVKQELEKTMDQVGAPSRAIRLWRESGAMQVLLPELLAADEAIRATDCAAQPGLPRRPGRRLTRFAVLFSDMSPAKALALATRLRFSRHDAQWISALVDRWSRLGDRMSKTLAGAQEQHGQRATAESAELRRWIAAIGRPQLPAFYRIASARWTARKGSAGSQASPTAQTVHSLYRRSLRAAISGPVDLRDLAVDGDDLRRAGIPAGPELGKILTALLDHVLEDPEMNNRDRLIEVAKRLHSGR